MIDFAKDGHAGREYTGLYRTSVQHMAWLAGRAARVFGLPEPRTARMSKGYSVWLDKTRWLIDTAHDTAEPA